MSENTGEPFSSRSYRSGDEVAVIELYNLITGRSRTTKEYKWEWLDTSEGQGSIWVIEKKDTREIVGHHGLIPIPLCYFGQPMLAGKTENTMVHPQYRGKLGYTRYEKRFLEEAKDRFDLLYTTNGFGAPARIRRRLGYFSVGGYAPYLKVCQKSTLDEITKALINANLKPRWLAKLANWASRLFNYVLIASFRGGRPTDMEITLEKIDSIEGMAKELNNLWDRSKSHFGITINRHAHYLKWRIFDNPNLTYDFFVASREGEVLGYVVIEYRGKAEAVIVDLLADGNDDVLFNSILQKIIQKLGERDIHTILFPTLQSRNALNRALRRNGFRSFSTILKMLYKFTKHEEPLLLVKTLDSNLDDTIVSDPENWYFTSIFREGLNRSSSMIKIPTRD